MQLSYNIKAVYVCIEIGQHGSLNWRALFMRPDFLSTKDYAVAGLRVESSPTPTWRLALFYIVVVGP